MVSSMNKDAIKQVLVEFQEAALPLLIARDMAVPLDTQKVVTIGGPRRSGKTSLLFLLIQQLLSEGVPKTRIAYINFEDPRLLPAAGKDIVYILECIAEFFPNNAQKVHYIFLDGIQHINHWEAGVRHIQETRRARAYCALAGIEPAAGALAGRTLHFELLPFSLKEFLRIKNIAPSPITPYSQERFSVRKYSAEYCAYGGLPEIVLQPDPALRMRILKEYVETVCLRDVFQRYHVKNQTVMRELVKFLVAHPGAQFSLNAFWVWIKKTYPLTKRTMVYYVQYLESAGVIYLTKDIAHTDKAHNVRPRKAYIFDNGIRALYGLDAHKDQHMITENTVYMALRRRRCSEPRLDISFWRNSKGQEVDFIVRIGTTVNAVIQICLDPAAFNARQARIEFLGTVLDECAHKEATVITDHYEKEEKIGNKIISFIPLWKWAMQQ